MNVIATVGAMAVTSINTTGAVLRSTVFEAAVPGMLMPDDVTINGQARPLPRTWGIDRSVVSFSHFADVQLTMSANLGFPAHVPLVLISSVKETSIIPIV